MAEPKLLSTNQFAGYGCTVTFHEGNYGCLTCGATKLWFDKNFMLKALLNFNAGGASLENRNNDKGKGGKADDTKVNTKGAASGNVSSSAAGGAQQARASDLVGAALRDKLQREGAMDSGRGESDPWEPFTLPNTGR